MPINTLRFSLRHIPWLLHDMIRTNPSIHKVTESPTPQKGIVWCATSMMCTIFMHKHISANNSNIVGFLCFLLKITWNSPCVSSKVTAREVLGVIKLMLRYLRIRLCWCLLNKVGNKQGQSLAPEKGFGGSLPSNVLHDH